MAGGTDGPRGSANKWLAGLAIASLVVGGYVVWKAKLAAEARRNGVVGQIGPALTPSSAQGATGAGTTGVSDAKSDAKPDLKTGASEPGGVKPAAPGNPAPVKTTGSGKPIDPAKIDQILESAGVYLKRDEGSKAEAILREGVASYAEEPRLHAAYGDFLVTQRRFEDAYAQYVAAVATGHTDGTKPGPEDAKIEFTAGTLASKLGKTEKAMEHYTAAQSEDPRNAEYPLYLGQMQRKLGKNDEAKVSLLRAAKLDPGRAIAWGSLADISLKENNVEIALQHIKKARDLEPDSTVWRVVEARALNRKGEPQKALDLIVGLSEAEKNQPEVARLIGECLGMLGKKDEAAEWMKKAEKK